MEDYDSFTRQTGFDPRTDAQRLKEQPVINLINLWLCDLEDTPFFNYLVEYTKCLRGYRFGKYKDIFGYRFGSLLPLFISRIDSQSRAIWIAICKCGLRSYKQTFEFNNRSDCGCGFHDRFRSTRSGRLVAKFKAQGKRSKRSNHSLWVCQCDCGGSTLATKEQIINQRKKSCGCLRFKSKHIKSIPFDRCNYTGF